MGAFKEVADGLAFPNGMAISTDGGMLIVAESYAERLTAYDIADDGTLTSSREWAATPGDRPDGICLDADGAVGTPMSATSTACGYAKAARFSRRSTSIGVRSHVLSARPTDPTLFVVGQNWSGPDAIGDATGQVVAFPAPAPGSGHP